MSKVIEEHGGSRSKKVLQLDEYQGSRYLELAQYYFKKKESEWKKKRGITLNKDNYRTIKEALDKEHEAIMDWLGVGYVPEDVSRYNEVQEKAAEDNQYAIGDYVVSEFTDRRNPLFFRIEHQGGKDVIFLNAAHPFKTFFAQLGDESKLLILSMLQAFNHSKEMLQGQPAFDPEMLFSHLQLDWSRYFKDSLEKQK